MRRCWPCVQHPHLAAHATVAASAARTQASRQAAANGDATHVQPVLKKVVSKGARVAARAAFLGLRVHRGPSMDQCRAVAEMQPSGGAARGSGQGVKGTAREAYPPFYCRDMAVPGAWMGGAAWRSRPDAQTGSAASHAAASCCMGPPAQSSDHMGWERGPDGPTRE